MALNIAARRKAMKMNQRDFAALAGIGESTLKYIEADISPGSQPIKEAIAMALGTTVEELNQRPPDRPAGEVYLSDLSKGEAKIIDLIENRLSEREVIQAQAREIEALKGIIASQKETQAKLKKRLLSFEAGRTPELVDWARSVFTESELKIAKEERALANQSKTDHSTSGKNRG